MDLRDKPANLADAVLDIYFTHFGVERRIYEKQINKCKILSLEQRMRKQILWIMFLLSKEENLIEVPVRDTRAATKHVSKVPNRITPKYEKSPFYIGTKLWDELS